MASIDPCLGHEEHHTPWKYTKTGNSASKKKKDLEKFDSGEEESQEENPGTYSTEEQKEERKKVSNLNAVMCFLCYSLLFVDLQELWKLGVNIFGYACTFCDEPLVNFYETFFARCWLIFSTINDVLSSLNNWWGFN